MEEFNTDRLTFGNGSVSIGQGFLTYYNCPKHGDTFYTIMVVKDNLGRNYCQSCVSEIITPELIEGAGIMPLEKVTPTV